MEIVTFPAVPSPYINSFSFTYPHLLQKPVTLKPHCCKSRILLHSTHQMVTNLAKKKVFHKPLSALIFLVDSENSHTTIIC